MSFLLSVSVKVVTHYNQLHEVEENEPCKDFELSVDINESSGNLMYRVQFC